MLYLRPHPPMWAPMFVVSPVIRCGCWRLHGGVVSDAPWEKFRPTEKGLICAKQLWLVCVLPCGKCAVYCVFATWERRRTDSKGATRRPLTCAPCTCIGGGETLSAPPAPVYILHITDVRFTSAASPSSQISPNPHLYNEHSVQSCDPLLQPLCPPGDVQDAYRL